MSNSTRPSGYDERLVVPLEASRRGAHRARTSPLLAALPLLAVALVVAAVIGVAYALFLRPSGSTSASGPGVSEPATTSSAPATTAPGTTQTSGSGSSSASPSSSASASTSTPAETVSKSATVTVYNGTQISGLAASVTNRLSAAGFTKAQVSRGALPANVSRTTVFYARSRQLATARAIAQALGVGQVERRASGSGIVVVAAADAQR